MKRTIFLNGRRRTLRALMFGAAVALFSVPVAQANHQFGDALDRAKNDKVQVIPYLSHGIGVSAQPDLVDRLVAQAAQNNVTSSREKVEGLLAMLPPEDVKAIEQSLSGGSATRSVYFRADDFAPPRNVEVSAATGAGVDWSETAIWLAVGLAGALGLLGLGLVANRSRVRMAHS
jgi:hypothetical protein